MLPGIFFEPDSGFQNFKEKSDLRSLKCERLKKSMPFYSMGISEALISLTLT